MPNKNKKEGGRFISTVNVVEIMEIAFFVNSHKCYLDMTHIREGKGREGKGRGGKRREEKGKDRKV